MSVIYDVPIFTFGLPIYDQNKCVQYIIKNLHKRGFLACISHNGIFISWDPVMLIEYNIDGTTKYIQKSKNTTINYNNYNHNQNQNNHYQNNQIPQKEHKIILPNYEQNILKTFKQQNDTQININNNDGNKIISRHKPNGKGIIDLS